MILYFLYIKEDFYVFFKIIFNIILFAVTIWQIHMMFKSLHY